MGESRNIMSWLHPTKRWLAAGWGWTSRFLRRATLPTAVLSAVIAAAALAFAANWILRLALPHNSEPIQPKDLTQFSLAIVAGIGGVVALVVAYRRQQGIEQSRFVERFGAAASQLGHADVAVRLAGVYAMAGVADETTAHERQQCVDVLCGYLRLPYSPELGANHQAELQRKVPAREGEESIRRYLYRQNDSEVRKTIVRVIAERLQDNARESWSDCDFDFQGAVFENASFSGSIFRGRQTLFGGATFQGLSALFIGASFSGLITDFRSAKLCAENAVVFSHTTFDGVHTRFDNATFQATEVLFEDATFNSDNAIFFGATFGGRWNSFKRAAFIAETDFRVCRFKGTVSFENPRQWKPSPHFDWDESEPEDWRRSKPDNVRPADWPPQEDRRA